MEPRMMWRLEVYNQHHYHQNNQHQYISVITTIAVTLIVMKNLMVFISPQLGVSLPRTRRRWTRSMPSTTTPRSLSLLGIKVIFTLIQVNKTLCTSILLAGSPACWPPWRRAWTERSRRSMRRPSRRSRCQCVFKDNRGGGHTNARWGPFFLNTLT